MTQTLTAASKPVALDYDNTLVAAIEVSNVRWVLAAQVPGLPRLKAKRSVEPTAEALMAASTRRVGRGSGWRDGSSAVASKYTLSSPRAFLLIGGLAERSLTGSTRSCC
jgi:hypothetical protein